MLNIIWHQKTAVKTTVRYHYTPVRMAKISSTMPNAGEDVELQELSFIAGVNAQRSSHFGGQLDSFL